MASLSTKTGQKKFVEALRKSGKNLTKACQMFGISRTAFYKVYKKDQEFRALVDEIKTELDDRIESKLIEMCEHAKNEKVRLDAITYYLSHRHPDYMPSKNGENNIDIKIIPPNELFAKIKQEKTNGN